MSDGYAEMAASRVHWDAKREAELVNLRAEVERLTRELGETNEALAACQSQAGGEIRHLQEALRAANAQIGLLACLLSYAADELDAEGCSKEWTKRYHEAADAAFAAWDDKRLTP